MENKAKKRGLGRGLSALMGISEKEALTISEENSSEINGQGAKKNRRCLLA